MTRTIKKKQKKENEKEVYLFQLKVLQKNKGKMK
jgi:hypothetical protein